MHKENNRIGSVIILRGVAALAVCFLHIALITNLHVSRLIDFIIINGQHGVAIFFVISGFILPYSLYKKGYALNNFFSFLIRRSIRIDPPYWFSIILLFVAGVVPLSLLNFKSILLHLFYLVPFVKHTEWYANVYWTLSIEFQFYILLGLFYPLLSKINAYAAIICLILVSAVLIFLDLGYYGVITSYFYDFVFGYIAFLGYTGRFTQARTVIIIALFGIFVIFKVSFTLGIIPLLTALFIVLFKNNKLPKAVSFVGNISYSLYLIHMIVSAVFVKIVGHFISNSFLLFPMSLVVSILFAYIFYRLIEKPSIDLSRTFKI